MSSLLERHAPLKTRTRVAVNSYYNEAIDNAKGLRRKAERKWRRTKRVNDFIDYKAKRNQVTFLMNSARRTFYTELWMITVRTIWRKLFNAVESIFVA